MHQLYERFMCNGDFFRAELQFIGVQIVAVGLKATGRKVCHPAARGLKADGHSPKPQPMQPTLPIPGYAPYRILPAIRLDFYYGLYNFNMGVNPNHKRKIFSYVCYLSDESGL
jgi:hypothetical protein